VSPLSHLISNEDGTPLVVALVEDDRLLREEIEVHLNAHGFEVHAVNSASALDDLLTQVADCSRCLVRPDRWLPRWWR
jgi:DNA-binding response OmpR family regulator